MLGRGLFLDGTAAAILCDRGFAADIGLRHITPPAKLESLGAFAAEEFTHVSFGGSARFYLSAQLPQVDYSARFAVMGPDAAAALIATLVGPDTRPVHPCMIAFENARGGHIIVHGWDYATSIGPLGVSFHSPARSRQLQGAVRWLFRGAPPLLANSDGAWPLAFRKDVERSTLIGLFNLSLDPWPGADFQLSSTIPIASLSVLDPDGSWHKLGAAAHNFDGTLAHVSVQRSIALDSPLFLNIAWAADE